MGGPDGRRGAAGWRGGGGGGGGRVGRAVVCDLRFASILEGGPPPPCPPFAHLSCLAPSGTPRRSPPHPHPSPSPQVLPTFFKHSKLSSFVQQLYTYGFRRCQDSTQYTLAALPTPKIPGAALGDGTPSLVFEHEIFRQGATADELMTIRRGGSSASRAVWAARNAAAAAGYSGEAAEKAAAAEVAAGAGGGFSPYLPGAAAAAAPAAPAAPRTAEEEVVVAELLREIEQIEGSISHLRTMQARRRPPAAPPLSPFRLPPPPSPRPLAHPAPLLPLVRPSASSRTTCGSTA